jgi:DNA repair exonuclease SbcCD ATPase subunit
MITFQSVSYQNFLACGAAPITLPLNTHATTLMVGRNGSGKSTVMDAICFALFGKPFRNLNKPLLVNSINKQDCLVTLMFQTSTGAYEVRRGIKPNVFEIYRNGVLEPVPADLDDYQVMLENILKLNGKSFKQVVVLGSSSYVPFMRLTAADRRKIIEDLLDIEIFSSMNALAKDDLSTVKTGLDIALAERRSLSEQLKIAETYSDMLDRQSHAAVQHVIASMQRIAQDASALLTERDAIVASPAFIKDLPAAKAAHVATFAKVQEYDRVLRDLRTKERDLAAAAVFYDTHETCPECEQVITVEFKATKQQILDTKRTALAQALVRCMDLLTNYQREAGVSEASLSAATTAIGRVQQLEHTIQVHKKQIEELKQQQARVTQPPVAPVVDVPALQAQLATVDSTHSDLSRQKVTLDAAALLLKDNGIRTRIIKHYLPIINKTVNHYLSAMDFPILFQFDETFKESMKSRYRDDFTYESFSDGEKKRIDLALLFTWRDVAKLKNSAATNLLIMDEVLDSSLDVNGVDELTKVVHTMEPTTRIIIISHRIDQLADKFDHTVQFEKQKGFSCLK